MVTGKRAHLSPVGVVDAVVENGLQSLINQRSGAHHHPGEDLGNHQSRNADNQGCQHSFALPLGILPLEPYPPHQPDNHYSLQQVGVAKENDSLVEGIRSMGKLIEERQNRQVKAVHNAFLFSTAGRDYSERSKVRAGKSVAQAERNTKRQVSRPARLRPERRSSRFWRRL